MILRFRAICTTFPSSPEFGETSQAANGYASIVLPKQWSFSKHRLPRISEENMALLFCHVPHTHTTNSTTGIIIAILTILVKTFVDQKKKHSIHPRYEILTSQTLYQLLTNDLKCAVLLGCDNRTRPDPSARSDLHRQLYVFNMSRLCQRIVFFVTNC